MVGVGGRAGPATIGIDPLGLEGGTDLQKLGITFWRLEPQLVKPINIVIEKGRDQTVNQVVIFAPDLRFARGNGEELIDPALAAFGAASDVGIGLIERRG